MAPAPLPAADGIALPGVTAAPAVWRRLGNGDIGIVTILHARMHPIARIRDDVEP